MTQTLTCPRCGGWRQPAVLEGRQAARWLILRCHRCVNCGWYGGEAVLDGHLGWQDRLPFVSTASA